MLKLLLKILILTVPAVIAHAATYTVTANPDLTFTPATLTINVGDTVTWKNAGGNHNVVADNRSFANGLPATSNWTYSYTFNSAGTFGYYCTEHGGPGGYGMSGSITVNSAATTPSIALGGYMSGNWYDPSQSGHGFELEFTNQASGTAGQNFVVAYWYVFTPDGTAQNWISGVGPYDSTQNTVTVPAVLVGGGKFPYPLSNFDPNAIQQPSWGTLTFTFTDCNNGTASWTSTVSGYGNGSMPIARLTSVAGTSCPAP